MRKYRFHDEFYFQKPDIENSYWAGFIAADGCVSNKGNSLSIALAEKDKKHLLLFANTIKYTGNLLKHEKTKSYRLNIYGAQNINKHLLENYNITPRKSLTLQPPNLEDNFHIKSFIVGLIDGDGCILISKRDKTLILNLVGSKYIIEWVKIYLEEIYDLESKTIYKPGNIYHYRLEGKNAVYVLEDLK